MARPLKAGMDYFPHDTDAASDEKIEPLLMLYGAKGYALYFVLLERIYRQDNFELDVSDAETIQLFCNKLQITRQEYDSIISTCIKRGAFDSTAYTERQVLTSNGVKKRASVVVQKRESMRKNITDAGTHQELCNNSAETPQSKGKESKGKKRKEGSIGHDCPAPPDQIPYSEIVSALNDATGSRFKTSSDATRKHVKARFNDGYTKDDFLAVISSKVDEWGKDAKMSHYLRPETLFGPKFESYLETAKKTGGYSTPVSGRTREACDYFVSHGTCRDRSPDMCATCTSFKLVQK